MAKLITLFTVFFLALASHLSVRAQSITENFDDISTLAGNGWSISNVSSPVGSLNWFQGKPAIEGFFDAYNGAANSYIAADYHSTGTTGVISNWLITPNRTFRNGDVITFYTRKVSLDTYADHLEVRLSTNGASTNVGNASTVGDFTEKLLEINPSIVTGVYPTTWTLYTITISGLPAPTSGRIGFRYYLPNGGVNGSTSDFIGIDAFQYTPYVCPAFTMTPSGALTGGTASVAYSNSITQIGALGAPNYAITAGALPPGLTLSSSGVISGTPTATGTFNHTITVNDNSGCSASNPYSITVVCPSNPITFNSFAVCSNDDPVLLTTGLPGGGTYSGTGVSGSYFDPTAGTQNVTYDYTDPYGCAFNVTSAITVNTAPTVTLSAFNSPCLGTADITLSGGSPAGGVYSGTYVSGGLFTPSVLGTTSITYSYTDANLCSGEAIEDITVAPNPQASLAALDDVCMGSGDVALAGGSPAGGVYSGTNVSGGLFTPSTSGSTTITYTYTDANGCSDEATTSITVSVCSGVSENLVIPGLKYFPNPTTGMLSVEFDPNYQSEIQILISDVQGKKILTDNQSSYSRTLDLSGFPNGVYTMELRAGGKTAHYKIVVK